MHTEKPKNKIDHLAAPPGPLSRVLILLVRLYQATFSHFLGGQCRFIPTCSEYAVQAIKKYGPIKGSMKTLCRLLKCNPLARGGLDEP